MKIKVIVNVDIDELNLSVRAWNCLRRAKIDTVQDIVDRYDNLNKVRNLGQRCYDEITEKIKPYVEFVDRVYTTNYDRIKSMSVEEMAEFLLRINDIDNSISFCQNKNECNEMLNSDKEIPEKMCSACMKQWLLQEVSDK